MTQGKIPDFPVFPEDIGLKKTKQREEVFQILASAKEPMGAQEIYQCLLNHTGNKNAYAISTVYRILAAFEEKNLVSKSTLPGGENAVYEISFQLANADSTAYAQLMRNLIGGGKGGFIIGPGAPATMPSAWAAISSFLWSIALWSIGYCRI